MVVYVSGSLGARGWDAQVLSEGLTRVNFIKLHAGKFAIHTFPPLHEPSSTLQERCNE